MDIHSVYQNLAQEFLSDSDHDQDAAAAAMSDLGAALQQVEAPQQAPISTLADAWKPCQLLPFETDIAAVSQPVLQHRAGGVRQAFSDDPTVILNNLRTWRNKYLNYLRTAQVTNRDLERIKDGVEALRAKAYLLYIAANDNKMRQAQRQQPEAAVAAAAGMSAQERNRAGLDSFVQTQFSSLPQLMHNTPGTQVPAKQHTSRQQSVRLAGAADAQGRQQQQHRSSGSHPLLGTPHIFGSEQQQQQQQQQRGPLPAGHPGLVTAPLPHQASVVVPARARAGGGTAAGRLQGMHGAGQSSTAAKQLAVLTHCDGSWQARPVAAAGRPPPTAVQQQLVYQQRARQRLPDMRRGPQQQPNAPGQAAGGRSVTSSAFVTCEVCTARKRRGEMRQEDHAGVGPVYVCAYNCGQGPPQQPVGPAPLKADRMPNLPAGAAAAAAAAAAGVSMRRGRAAVREGSKDTPITLSDSEEEEEEEDVAVVGPPQQQQQQQQQRQRSLSPGAAAAVAAADIAARGEEEGARRRQRRAAALANTHFVDMNSSRSYAGLSGQFPPSGGRGAVSVCADDMEFLDPEAFLNDTVLDYYIKFIEAQLPQVKRDRLHFFNTFFYKKLSEKSGCGVEGGGRGVSAEERARQRARANHARVKTWTKGVDIFSKDYLFVPIHDKVHWSLVIICHPNLLAQQLQQQEQQEQQEQQAQQAAAKGRRTKGPVQQQQQQQQQQGQAVKQSIGSIVAAAAAAGAGMVRSLLHPGSPAKQQQQLVRAGTPCDAADLLAEERSGVVTATAEAAAAVARCEEGDGTGGCCGDLRLVAAAAGEVASTVAAAEAAAGTGEEDPLLPTQEWHSPNSGISIGNDSSSSELSDGGQQERQQQQHTAAAAGGGSSSSDIVREPCILSLDSMTSGGHASKAVCDMLRDYLACEWARRQQEGSQTDVEPPCLTAEMVPYARLSKANIPIQPNHCDCGLFVLTYLEYFVAGLPAALNTRDVKAAASKKHPLDEPILSPDQPGLLSKSWFHTEVASALREHLRAQLLSLMLDAAQERGDAELLSSEGVVRARSEVEEQREVAAQQQALIDQGRLDSITAYVPPQQYWPTVHNLLQEAEQRRQAAAAARKAAEAEARQKSRAAAAAAAGRGRKQQRLQEGQEVCVEEVHPGAAAVPPAAAAAAAAMERQRRAAAEAAAAAGGGGSSKRARREGTAADPYAFQDSDSCDDNAASPSPPHQQPQQQQQQRPQRRQRLKHLVQVQQDACDAQLAEALNVSDLSLGSAGRQQQQQQGGDGGGAAAADESDADFEDSSKHSRRRSAKKQKTHQQQQQQQQRRRRLRQEDYLMGDGDEGQQQQQQRPKHTHFDDDGNAVEGEGEAAAGWGGVVDMEVDAPQAPQQQQQQQLESPRQPHKRRRQERQRQLQQQEQQEEEDAIEDPDSPQQQQQRQRQGRPKRHGVSTPLDDAGGSDSDAAAAAAAAAGGRETAFFRQGAATTKTNGGSPGQQNKRTTQRHNSSSRNRGLQPAAAAAAAAAGSGAGDADNSSGSNSSDIGAEGAADEQEEGALGCHSSSGTSDTTSHQGGTQEQQQQQQRRRRRRGRQQPQAELVIDGDDDSGSDGGGNSSPPQQQQHQQQPSQKVQRIVQKITSKAGGLDAAFQVVYAACPALRELSDASAAELFDAHVLNKVQQLAVFVELQRLAPVEGFSWDQVPQVVAAMQQQWSAAMKQQQDVFRKALQGDRQPRNSSRTAAGGKRGARGSAKRKHPASAAAAAAAAAADQVQKGLGQLEIGHFFQQQQQQQQQQVTIEAACPLSASQEQEKLMRLQQAMQDEAHDLEGDDSQQQQQQQQRGQQPQLRLQLSQADGLHKQQQQLDEAEHPIEISDSEEEEGEQQQQRQQQQQGTRQSAIPWAPNPNAPALSHFAYVTPPAAGGGAAQHIAASAAAAGALRAQREGRNPMWCNAGSRAGAPAPAPQQQQQQQQQQPGRPSSLNRQQQQQQLQARLQQTVVQAQVAAMLQGAEPSGFLGQYRDAVNAILPSAAQQQQQQQQRQQQQQQVRPLRRASDTHNPMAVGPTMAAHRHQHELAQLLGSPKAAAAASTAAAAAAVFAPGYFATRAAAPAAAAAAAAAAGLGGSDVLGLGGYGESGEGQGGDGEAGGEVVTSQPSQEPLSSPQQQQQRQQHAPGHLAPGQAAAAARLRTSMLPAAAAAAAPGLFGAAAGSGCEAVGGAAAGPAAAAGAANDVIDLLGGDD